MLKTLAFATLFAFTGAAYTANAAQVASSRAATTTQIPRNVRPSHYDVSITPDAKALTFTGHVGITIEVLEPTTTITLQAVDMTFSAVQLSSPDGREPFGSPKTSTSDEEQTATFTFPKQVLTGRYRLALDYTGKIGTQAAGLFAIDYDTKDGQRRALYTQFENSDARRMVPSWDEPVYKATFTLSATIPKGEMAVSNMPVAKTSDASGGKSLVEFQPSPKMSTYLLFLALGEFERVTTTIDGTEVGVVTRKGVTSQAAFALESSKAVLHEYNDYFGAPYPLPKLDNIAAPGSSQFFGAMENWGAIFTFEYAILLDPSISTQADKQESFKTAAHEISHQWFGDLVTMSWWDDLWLNEGFASWMEGRTTEKLHPEWNTALEAVNGRESAMRFDALKTTHPVVQHIETVEQASQAFDAITYQKGEAVIRMLEGYVGPAAWRDGVRRYVKAHTYGSTVSDDLWQNIEAAAKKPITAIAHDFTLQPGVPMITVEGAACVAGQTRVTLTQGEFSKDAARKKPLLWRTPVLLKSLSASTPVQGLVTGGKASMTLPGCEPVIVNAGQSGYFRTLYSPAPFARLVAGFPRLAPIDQMGVIVDAWALGLAGEQIASDVLDLALATPPSADPQIWGRLGRIFLTLNTYYRGQEEAQARFRKFAVSRLAPVFERVGWTALPGEKEPVAILRADLIEMLSDLGDAAVIGEATRRFKAQAHDASAIPPPLRKAILSVVAQHADAATWEQLHAAALSETTPLVKDQLYRLLPSADDEKLVRRALDLALTKEPGATNSAAMISAAAITHPDLAFDFALAHMNEVDERVDASSRTRYYAGLAFGSSDPAMIEKVNAYAMKHLAAGSRREADSVAANIADRIRIRNERLPAIDAWLRTKAR